MNLVLVKSQKKICRRVSPGDINAVVTVHRLAFSGFFLTSLGVRFLRVMYKTFSLDPSGLFFVSEANGRILGFAVGIMNDEENDRSLALRYLPEFLLAAIPAVCMHPVSVLKRLGSVFFSFGDQPKIPVGAAVLRSIGIIPDMKGSGIANDLLNNFEQQAKKKSAKFVALTTDSFNNGRAINFYKKNGYQIFQEFKNSTGRNMLVMVKAIDL